MTSAKQSEIDRLRAFDRGMYRSALVSLLWSVVTRKRKTEGLTLQDIADKLGVNKSQVSRWFRGDPNWSANTVADLAHVLDVELTITATERATGIVHSPSGVIEAHRSGNNTKTAIHVVKDFNEPSIRPMTYTVECKVRAA